jgi:3-dehydroquinate synthase
VRFCERLLRPGGPLAEAIGDRRALLVTTPTVDRLHGAALRSALRGMNAVGTLVLDAREETKSMALVERVCAEALARGVDRRGLLVAVGGGVCSDVVTLSAALVRRGIGHVRVPTTLLGQIDAGIGLKGAVNFAGKKSFLGCFHPPEQVLVDPAFLRTLPRRHLVSGLGEAAKMGIARDARLFELVERRGRALTASAFAEPAAEGLELLERSVRGMLDELGRNPYEDQGYERLVDFGHTFSPALEAALGFEIQHGEAVAVDIALSAAIARARGTLDAAACSRIVEALRGVGLPVAARRLDLALCRGALDEAARHRGGAMNLVVPAGVGRAVFLRRREEVPDDLLEEALASLEERAAVAP